MMRGTRSERNGESKQRALILLGAVPNGRRALGEGERILPHQRFVRRADGELEPSTEGSTKPIAETRTHAGIVKVKRYAFTIT